MNFYSCINASCNYYTDEEFNDKMRVKLEDFKNQYYYTSNILPIKPRLTP